jgi:hypothetical protein
MSLTLSFPTVPLRIRQLIVRLYGFLQFVHGLLGRIFPLVNMGACLLLQLFDQAPILYARVKAL